MSSDRLGPSDLEHYADLKAALLRPHVQKQKATNVAKFCLLFRTTSCRVERRSLELSLERSVGLSLKLALGVASKVV